MEYETSVKLVDFAWRLDDKGQTGFRLQMHGSKSTKKQAIEKAIAELQKMI